ncbi:MAG: FHA domain-containing protein [Isosphaeraceae bacterium]|nr:FHA domain-containing protein [Isosphaeraceae bacterium]
MDVQLIVVQGKHQGKTIPLRGPVFRIGRGETCHLRPNSAQVSREHAEITVVGTTVSVRDLGSRNGTLVNGKALTAPCVLKDKDVVMVGPLTFAVTLGGAAPVSEVIAAVPAAGQAAPHDTDSWFLTETSPGGGSKSGDTVLIPAFTGAVAPDLDDEASDDSYERQASSDSEVRERKARPADAPVAEHPKVAAGGADPGGDIIRKIMGYGRPTK